MENMMPQLGLPNKTIQQQPRSSQSFGKSGNMGGREKDFRDLLESSSKKDLPKEKETSRSDLREKTDGQQPLKKQDTAAKEPDSVGKKEETVDEEILIDVGMQAFQLLMMGSGHLENMQPEGIAEIQPETADTLTALPLQGLTEDTGGQSGEVLAIDRTATEGVSGEEQLKDLGAEKIPAAEEKIPAVQERAGEIQPDRIRKTDSGVQKEKASEKKTETGSEIRVTDRDAVRQTTAPTGSEEQAGAETEQSGRFSEQVYAAQSLHQEHVQGSRQGQEAVPVIHVQAARPQELMDQLLDQLKAKMSMKDQEFEIQLHPENLGKLAIKVAYTAEKVSISIVCSNERTMELLSSGAKNIAQIMEENLGTPTTVMVDQNESDYLEQYNNQENPKQQQQDQERSDQKNEKDEHQDFLQQLRLGLI